MNIAEFCCNVFLPIYCMIMAVASIIIIIIVAIKVIKGG